MSLLSSAGQVRQRRQVRFASCSLSAAQADRGSCPERHRLVQARQRPSSLALLYACPTCTAVARWSRHGCADRAQVDAQRRGFLVEVIEVAVGCGISPGPVRCQVPRGPKARASRSPGSPGRGEGAGREASRRRDAGPRRSAGHRYVRQARHRCPHLRQDRRVCGRTRGDQAKVCAQLAPGDLELGHGELPDIVGAGHGVSRTQ